MRASDLVIKVRVENLEPVKQWVNKAQAVMYEVAGELGAILEHDGDIAWVQQNRQWLEHMIARLEEVADGKQS